MIKFQSRMTKLFFSYLTIVMIPLIVICSIIYFTNKGNEEKNYMEVGMNNIMQISNNADFMLSTYENLSFQIASIPLLNQLASEPGNKYDYLSLKNELDKYRTPQGTALSIYAYLKSNYTVLTTSEGLFKVDEFHDKDILLQESQSKLYSRGLVARRISSSYFSNNSLDVFSVIREIPYSGNSKGKLVVNFDEAVFYNEMSKNRLKGSNVFVVGSDQSVISGDTKELLQLSAKNAYFIENSLDKYKDSRIIKITGNKYFLFYITSKVTDWKYVSLIPYSTIDVFLNRTKTLVTRIFILVLIISVLLGYIFSKVMYSPFKKLMTIAGDYMKSLGNQDNTIDEYVAVSKVMERLISDNSNTKALLIGYKPIVKEKLLSDILYENVFGEEEIRKRMEYSDLFFEHDSFIASIASVIGSYEEEKAGIPVDMKIYARTIAEKEFQNSGLSANGILMGEDNIAFIINFDSDIAEHQLRERLSKISDNINTLLNGSIKAGLFFSFGSICYSLGGIGLSFNEAKGNLNYRAVSDDSFLIFESEGRVVQKYPMLLQKQLVNSIRAYDTALMEDLIKKFFEEYVDKLKCSQETFLQIIVMLLSSIYSDIIRECGNINILPEVDTIRLIQQCSRPAKVKEYMLESMKRIVSILQSSVETLESYDLYITKVIKFMEENYDHDISLGDISAYVNLNPKYLTKVFKSNTGKTIYEYLTLFRIEKAKELFTDGRLSMKEISKRIGYNDVHSFIRFFKKNEGITPGEYRDLKSKILV